MVDTPSNGAWWRRISWLWLALLVPALVFSNGRWQHAVGALAMPFFARLFLLSQPVIRGLLILLSLQLGAYLVMWWEIIPAPGILYYIIAAAYGLCYFLPFVIDRITAGRIAGFAGTLVLPLSWYLVEILIQWFTPYGSWSSAGYTQMGYGLLTPLAAWVGVSGVAFVTMWIASAAVWLITTTARAERRFFVIAVWAGSLVLLLWLARAPLGNDSPAVDAIEVAAITPSNQATLAVDRAVMEARMAGSYDDATLTPLKDVVAGLNNELLVRSRAAAQGGARLVVWSETAGRILNTDEDRLIARGQELARDEGVYLFMGIGVLHPGSQPPMENKVIAITPSGETVWEYQKARPIVGSEAPFLPPGHNILPTLSTPFGLIGLVICHDLDFADFVAQAGRKKVELLLAPSADWPIIADLHAKMGIMRAVENGFWLLRPAHDGLSVIASPQGQVTHSVYDADLEQRVFTGNIPVMRNHTPYPHVRPYLPWVAVILWLGLMVLARRD